MTWTYRDQWQFFMGGMGVVWGLCLHGDPWQGQLAGVVGANAIFFALLFLWRTALRLKPERRVAVLAEVDAYGPVVSLSGETSGVISHYHYYGSGLGWCEEGIPVNRWLQARLSADFAHMMLARNRPARVTPG